MNTVAVWVLVVTFQLPWSPDNMGHNLISVYADQETCAYDLRRMKAKAEQAEGVPMGALECQMQPVRRMRP
jgi:hypothetical protein